jgi:hypothetical protein
MIPKELTGYSTSLLIFDGDVTSRSYRTVQAGTGARRYCQGLGPVALMKKTNCRNFSFS